MSDKYSTINSYYKELENAKQYGGSDKESSIRSAFHNLLNDYCKTKGLILVDELKYKHTGKSPDGTVKDSYRLDRGYWEAKDSKDDLDLEISKKFAIGYPTDNIIFEDSRTAILFQHAEEVLRVDMQKPAELDKILRLFLGYKRPEILNFDKAVIEFGQNIPKIVETLRELIKSQTTGNNSDFLEKQEVFLKICQEAINPQISIEDVQEMLIQHILTEDIFLSVFDESQFHRENNIASQLFELEQTFLVGQTKRDLLTAIQPYYKIIKARASQISDHHEKQKFLKVVYENFYKNYNPDKADTLGIVYTPNEIVRFIISGCDTLSSIHFGKTLADKNVKILDPATGTGTFVTELIDYLPLQNLEYKYQNELFCNEIAILPYYVANLNIEFTYKQKTGKYQEFTNISLVDTLDNVYFQGKYSDVKLDGLFFGGVSLENTERIKRQNDQEISIILGNPPYNANQMNYNDHNANRVYEMVDARIKETYIAKSTAQKTKLYDMYSRFFRWASDRLQENGVVAFVTNSSFIESRTFDGFRKDVMEEFDFIYVMDCGGNVRAGQTDGNVFDIMTGVAVCFLVKVKKDENLPEWSNVKETCKLYYTKLHNIGRENKLQELALLGNDFRKIPFEPIIPDKKGNWVNLTSNDWMELTPMIDKENKKGIFDLVSLGVSTNRDIWVYDFDKTNLENKIKFFIEKYNLETDKIKTQVEKNNVVVDETLLESSEIKWSHTLVANAKSGNKAKFDSNYILKSNHRPFTEKYYYAEKLFSDRLTQNHYDIFGEGLDLENKAIAIVNEPQVPFTTFCSSIISNMHLGGRQSFLFPQYRYFKETDGSLKKVDNITDWALEQFKDKYPDEEIQKADIFHYVYGVLHDPEYRRKYETNLKQDFPRIPFYTDFLGWSSLGKKLLDLHLLEKVPTTNSQNFTVKNSSVEITPLTPLMPKLKADKINHEIILDQQSKITGIPTICWNYKLGNRSAIEWVLDQYKPKINSDKTVATHFDSYHWETLKPQVLELLQKVIFVSEQTMILLEEKPS